MAPHALTDHHDTSGYSPATVPFEKWLQDSKSSARSKTLTPNMGSVIFNSASDSSKIGDPLSQHVWRLSLDEIKDIESSIEDFQSSRLPLNAINKETFRLSESFRSKLLLVIRSIYGRQQFLVLSGMDPSQYTDVENVIIHAGLSSHIGGKRGMAGREGGDRSVLNHIIAMISSPKGTTGQYHGPPNQARDIPFHTDNGDIVSLYTLSKSQSGGSFYLADSTAVFEDLKALEPKFAQALVDDWIIVSGSPDKAFDIRPVAFPDHGSGRVLINCSRARFTGTPSAPRPVSLPPLTKTQRQALDALHILARRRAIEIQLQPGDMIFFNNMSMLHARDAFVDNAAEGCKRHILRLILRDEEMAYAVPPQLAETWKSLYEHNVEDELLPVKSELFSYAMSH